jgi:hypothetical protein
VVEVREGQIDRLARDEVGEHAAGVVALGAAAARFELRLGRGR